MERLAKCDRAAWSAPFSAACPQRMGRRPRCRWGGKAVILLPRREMTSYLARRYRREARVNSWSVQDAKARFSELLETCLNEGPQLVTRRGTDAAVLVPVRDWQKLLRMARPALKDLLLAEGPRTDITLPKRGGKRRRGSSEFA